MPNVFHLRPIVTLESTHDLYDAMNRHISQLKAHIEDETLEDDGVYIQAQMDVLWFFHDMFFSSYENATPTDFADYMYALTLAIAKRGEQIEKEIDETDIKT
jgi:hypothetical protein